jgi:hypothetical protein
MGQGPRVPPWNRKYHFFGTEEDTVSYLLVLDSLNFCFWPLPGKAKWEISYGSEKISGYYALAAALKTALESGSPLTKADYLSHLSLEELKTILGGRGELQLLERRLKILREVGKVLAGEFRSKALNLVEGAGPSAVKVAKLLAEAFSSFQDVATYGGQKIFFYKRAQIFAGDLYGAFEGGGPGAFRDMEALTAFADYKLPQVLRHVGILDYEPSLAKKVDQGVLLEAGSIEEVEIRANTIWAVELIRQELEGLGRSLMACEIDWLLWNMGQDRAFKEKPYHKTVTIFY